MDFVSNLCFQRYSVKNLKITGLLIYHGKKSKILRDFQGQICGKISRFRGIFAGKKSKFAEQSADFRRFSREKSQNSQENRPISRDFSGKESIFEGFSGANNFLRISQENRPISREISGGNFAKKQSVKNSRLRWVFLANFANIDQFCVDMTSVGECFF